MNFLVNGLKRKLVAILEIFSLALLHMDEIVLLAPTSKAMRLMLGVCDYYYALEYSILFNTKNLNVFHLVFGTAIHLLRKMYHSFLLEAL